MSTVAAIDQQRQTASADDPFRLGWRYVKVERPDGTVEDEQVPLTEDDVLHPLEEDFIMKNIAHDADVAYLRSVAKSRTRDRADWLVLCDCRVDWEVKGLRPHGPDLVVFEGVDVAGLAPALGTFYVGQEGARVRLVMEVTSPSTRDNDLGIKVQHYHAAGVPLYVIVDRDPQTGEVELIARQRTPRRYLRMAPDEQGRVWLEPLGVWLGVKDGRVVCYDGITDEEIGDYVAISAALEEEHRRADAEQARADAEQARADAEKLRVETLQEQLASEKARADQLEARLRQLEAQPSHRNG
jgi:hypothetical protein